MKTKNLFTALGILSGAVAITITMLLLQSSVFWNSLVVGLLIIIPGLLTIYHFIIIIFKKQLNQLCFRYFTGYTMTIFIIVVTVFSIDLLK
ncbi:MAG: hypothetical protein K9L74_06840 [Candidatus Izimaplasma sp.]|nr:hypothetical protein [Candidatus Izimaplasma bacterium]